MPLSLSSNDNSKVVGIKRKENNDDLSDINLRSNDPYHLNSQRSSNPERVLDLMDLIMIGIGNLIGSGIFTLSGIGAKIAGESIFISWMLSGFIAFLTVIIFAEISSKVKKSGSIYIYAYIINGEFSAW